MRIYPFQLSYTVNRLNSQHEKNENFEKVHVIRLAGVFSQILIFSKVKPNPPMAKYLKSI